MALLNKPSEIITVEIPADMSGRIDKALADLMPSELALSRSRLQELIQSGAVFLGGVAVTQTKRPVQAGEVYELRVPAPVALDLVAEDIPLDIAYEDDDLIVVNKPAGMVVHPGTGARDGTLVHALLHHCGASLSGIGGVERPGIVHRIDKDTSGLLVVAKHDRAHEGLGRQFRDHSIHRVYRAFVYGAPALADPKIRKIAGVSAVGGRLRIEGAIGRHKHDRLKMAVNADGKHAVTHVGIGRVHESDSLAEISCQLETGRTHQIRVHMLHVGFPLLGDPLYGKGSRHLSKTVSDELRAAIDGLQGQALHAAELGFVHPVSGKDIMLKSELRADMQKVSDLL